METRHNIIVIIIIMQKNLLQELELLSSDVNVDLLAGMQYSIRRVITFDF